LNLAENARIVALTAGMKQGVSLQSGLAVCRVVHILLEKLLLFRVRLLAQALLKLFIAGAKKATITRG
jgi:hypothetical protein